MERIMRAIDDLVAGEEGFSTVGVALALLVTLSLIFSAAQVYEVDSASADVQDIADATALASENVVGEFYIVASVCDAVVLSLSLSSVACLGIGVAATCIPPTAALGEKFISFSSDIAKARDTFGARANEGLSKLQGVLPYLAMAKAAQIAASNDTDNDAQYASVVVLSPLKGTDLEVSSFSAADDAADAVGDNVEDLEEAVKVAEDAAQAAKEWKQKAYEADSGSRSDYCMYQRAKTLAGLSGSANPYFSSVETWSFTAAFKRAKAYYKKRLSSESPEDSSVMEEARSALRKRVFKYAVKQMKKGYVNESETSFSAFFPLLPKNTSEMRDTELYTQSVYPVCLKDGKRVMHAWSGCPGIEGSSAGKGSISQIDSGGYEPCERCEFKPSSMGKVLAASTNIENGFEYYYRIVAEAAKEYEDAIARLQPAKEEASSLAAFLFGKIGEALAEAAKARIAVAPPGRMGSLVISADLSRHSAGDVFPSSFVSNSGSLGPRVALSSACLLREDSAEGETVISSFLDGFAHNGEGLIGAADMALDLWSGILTGYSQGQLALVSTVKETLDKIPFASESGLGDWASGKLNGIIEDAGLEPPELRAAKAVLVNSGDVLAYADGSFAARLLSLKKMALNSKDGSLFSGALSQAEQAALSSVSWLGDEIELGSITIFDGAIELPVVITLPPCVQDYAFGAISSVFGSIANLASSLTGERRWE